MRCRECSYLLWHLKSRQCPECGKPFLPSEYEFVAKRVEFHCPHCDRLYYGTGEMGHLDPPEFDCLSCAEHIHMDEMILAPPPGTTELQTQVEDMPWLESQQIGLLTAWRLMVSRAIMEPERLIKATPVTSSLAQAWWFAILTTLVVLLGAMFFLLMTGEPAYSLRLLLDSPRLSAGPWRDLPWIHNPLMLNILGAAIMFIVAVVGMACWGLTAHLLMRLTGKTRSGLRRTYHAVCYSSGANVFSVSPFLGRFLGWTVWAFSAIRMVREGQRVHTVRAAFAVLTFPILLVSLLLAAYFSS